MKIVDALIEVLHEDDDLLAVNKPAGLVCHPSKDGPHSSLIGRVRLHVGTANGVHLLNRLDRETSGIVLIAKNDATARELRMLWETRHVKKEYLAIVHGTPPQPQGIIEARLGKDDKSHVAIKDCVRPDGAAARTDFWVEATGSKFSLLRVVPHTGRKHQIRIHLAHIGHPIVGDKLYGGDEDLYLALVENRLTEAQRQRLILPHHALQATTLRFAWRGRDWEFRVGQESWPQEWEKGLLSRAQ